MFYQTKHKTHGLRYIGLPQGVAGMFISRGIGTAEDVLKIFETTDFHTRADYAGRLDEIGVNYHDLVLFLRAYISRNGSGNGSPRIW